MKYRIRLYMEDAEGGSWDQDAQFETQTAQGAEDIAVELACNELASGVEHDGDLVASRVRVEFQQGNYNRTIYVRGTQDSPDISIY